MNLANTAMAPKVMKVMKAMKVMKTVAKKKVPKSKSAMKAMKSMKSMKKKKATQSKRNTKTMKQDENLLGANGLEREPIVYTKCIRRGKYLKADPQLSIRLANTPCTQGNLRRL